MPTSVRLPKELDQRLSTLAADTGRSKAFYIREAIAEYIEDLEDIYLAEKVLQRVREGKETLYTLEEVEQNLGLAD